MFMRENALGITISRRGDMCRRKWYLGRGEEPLSHMRETGTTPEAGESLPFYPFYPVIPCMKPVVREDWKSLLNAEMRQQNPSLNPD